MYIYMYICVCVCQCEIFEFGYLIQDIQFLELYPLDTYSPH